MGLGLLGEESVVFDVVELLLPELFIELAGPDELLQVCWLLAVQHVQHHSI
jgi:hypothetical protein